MSMASIIDKQDEDGVYPDVLTCSICLELLTDPKVTPCMHTVCRGCLDKWIDQKGQEKCPCPVCTIEFEPPKDGAKGLKGNYILNNMLDALQKRLRRKCDGDVQYCNICLNDDEKVKATSKCIDCDQYICKACTRAHSNIKALKDHKVIQITGDERKDTKALLQVIPKRMKFCASHADEQLKFYCIRCKEVLCRDCCITTHSGHNCENLIEHVKEDMKNIATLIQTSVQREEEVDIAVRDVNDYKESLQKDALDVETKITKNGQLQIALINEYYNEELGKLERLKSEEFKKADAHINYLQMQNGITKSTRQLLDTQQQYGHPAEIINMRQEIAKKTEEWSKPQMLNFDSKIGITFTDGISTNSYSSLTLGKVVSKRNNAKPEDLFSFGSDATLKSDASTPGGFNFGGSATSGGFKFDGLSTPSSATSAPSTTTASTRATTPGGFKFNGATQATSAASVATKTPQLAILKSLLESSNDGDQNVSDEKPKSPLGGFTFFQECAKLYRFDSDTMQWKERGTGVIKILKSIDGTTVRILMRREHILAGLICANHKITQEMTLTAMPKNDKSWIWHAVDFYKGKSVLEQFCISFKTPESANKFKFAFESGKRIMAEMPKLPEKPKQQPLKVADTVDMSKFKPSKDSWDCETCYINNPGDKTQCPACYTVKPGCEPPAQAKPEGLTFGSGGSCCAAASAGGMKFASFAAPSATTSGGIRFDGSSVQSISTSTPSSATSAPIAIATSTSTSTSGGLKCGSSTVTAAPSTPTTSSTSTSKLGDAFNFVSTLSSSKAAIEKSPISRGEDIKVESSSLTETQGGFEIATQIRGLFGNPQTTTTGTSLLEKTTQTGGFFGNTRATTTRTSLIRNTTACTGGLFANTQTTTTVTSLFGNTTQTATGGLFGSSAATGFGAAAHADTTVKFNPVQGIDIMWKDGVSTQTTTRYQCITAMEEYDSKSMEELRVDDYLANWKGAQAQSHVSTPVTCCAFGAKTPGGFGTTTQTGGLLGNPQTTNTGTSLLGNATQTGGLFGNTQPKTTGTSLFGNTTQTGGLFGNTRTTTTGRSLFGNTAKTDGLFGNTQTKTTGTSLLGKTTKTATVGLFGGTAATRFGTATPTGTTVTFNPVQESDTMMKGGVSTQIKSTSSGQIQGLGHGVPAQGHRGQFQVLGFHPGSRPVAQAPMPAPGYFSTPPKQAISGSSSQGSIPVSINTLAVTGSPLTMAATTVSSTMPPNMVTSNTSGLPSQFPVGAEVGTPFTLAMPQNTPTIPPASVPIATNVPAAASVPLATSVSAAQIVTGTPIKVSSEATSLYPVITPVTPPTTGITPKSPKDLKAGGKMGRDRRISERSSDGEYYHENDSYNEPDFTPIVPLPEKVEVVTGEEDDEPIFQERAKLYRFDSETKQWKERGTGEMKILKRIDGTSVRILMRREQVLKICANHKITQEMALSAMPKNDKSWIWHAVDFSEGESVLEQFCIRFKTPELANEFKAAFEKGKKIMAAMPKSPMKPKEQPLKVVDTVDMSKFKPSKDSWDCETCYINNPGDRTQCPACNTVKPGCEPPPQAKPEGFTFGSGGSGFSFGSGAASTGGAAATSGGFKFGSLATPVAAVAVTSSSTGGFKFGGSSTPSSPTSASSTTTALTSATTSSGFKLGGTSTPSSITSAPSSATSTSAVTSGGFKFGGATPTTTATSVPATTPKSVGFTFGTTSATNTMTTSNKGAGILKSLLESGDECDQKVPDETAKSTLGGFTFSEKPKVADEKKPEPVAKPVEVKKTEEAPAAKPFSYFSFGSTKSTEEKSKPLAAFSFKAPEPTKKPDGPSSGVLFGSSGDASSFSSLASETAKTDGFKKTEGFKGFGGEGTQIFGSPSRTRKESEGSEGGDDYEPNADFKPIVPLPALVEVKTGEEEEEVLFSERAKLFRYETEKKEWKERGLGNMKILKHKETKKPRILMRREQVLKICANHAISTEMKMEPQNQSDKAWCWHANDFADGEYVAEFLAIKFKTPELAKNFKDVFDECQKRLGEISQDSSKADGSEKAGNVDDLGDRFKPKQGDWECPGCYVNHEANVDYCNCCGSNKPSDKQASNAEPKTTNGDLAAMFKPEEGSWECTDCYVRNGPKLVTCPACGATKLGETVQKSEPKSLFGSGPTGVIGESGGFRFGSGASPSTAAFSFGTQKPTSDTVDGAKPSSGFSFGKKSEQFSFGSASSPSAQKNEAGSSTSGPPSSTKATFSSGFSFSTPTTSSSTKPLGSGGFRFGSGASPSTAAFSFGTQKPTSDTVDGAKPSGGFSFGKKSERFSFGSASSSSAQKTEAGSSTSGPPSSTKATFSSGFSFSTPTTSSSTKPLGSGGFRFGSGASPSTAAFSFGTQKPTSDTVDGAKPSSGFSFGKKSEQFSFGSASSSSAQKTEAESSTSGPHSSSNGPSSSTKATFSFGKQSEPDYSTTGFSFGAKEGSTGFSFSMTPAASSSTKPLDLSKTPTGTAKSPGGDEGYYVNDDHDVHFEPIVPLPDKVEVKTGEEDEDILFVHRAKLFRYVDTQWKERGLGDIKILRQKSTNKTRLLMRREQILKICCNHAITEVMELKPMSKADGKAWVWFAMDCSEEEPKQENFAIKFKTTEIAQQFKDIFDKAKSNSSDLKPVENISEGSVTPKKDSSAKKEEFVLKSDVSTTPADAKPSEFKFTPSPPAQKFTSPQVCDALSFVSTPPSSKTTNEQSPLVRKDDIKVEAPSFTETEDSNDDIEIVYEWKPTPEQKKLAEKYMLNPGFYRSLEAPPCPGCRGCDEEDLIERAETTSAAQSLLGQLLSSTTPEVQEQTLTQQISSTTGNHGNLKLAAKQVPVEEEIVSSSTGVQGDCGNLSYSKELNKGASATVSEEIITSTTADVTVDKGNPEYEKQLDKGSNLVISPGPDAKSPATKDEKNKGDHNNINDEKKEDEEAGGYDDEYDDENNEDEDDEIILFQKRVTLSVIIGNNQPKTVGLGELLVLYDDEFFGSRVTMQGDDGNVICNHLVATETRIQRNRKKKFCEWEAIDYATNQPIRRTFRAQFSSENAAEEFEKMIIEGKEFATQSGIYERDIGCAMPREIDIPEVTGGSVES
ncbi:unnamed protein product [Owenia fusiformis]|uniref:Nuclear pore complex protein Nup98-Nup96 n=1 Tax=Owenia fusiformis TaxID=6347 RepID=A0A8S4NK00_OWEFU|nr:unnamed protein product [Owenia fusiformis]